MTSSHRIVPAIYQSRDLKSRQQLIEDILSRGKIVRFTNRVTGVTKDVKEWNADAYGDLTAFRHTGQTPYLCWSADQYEISELDE